MACIIMLFPHRSHETFNPVYMCDGWLTRTLKMFSLIIKHKNLQNTVPVIETGINKRMHIHTFFFIRNSFIRNL